MSANLNTKDGKAAMMYVGEVPWHGMGTALNKPATAAEALEHSGLDYKVIKVPIETNTNIPINGKFATIRQDELNSNGILGIVGKNYKVIQNTHAMSFFDEIVSKDEAIYHTAGALGKGERIWLLAKLPESMRINNEDIIDRYILLSNSHDGTSGTSSFIAKFTTVRVVCNNTLNVAINQKMREVRIRHTATAEEKIQEAYKVLGIAKDTFETTKKLFEKLSDQTVTMDLVEQFYDELLGIKQGQEEISTKMQNKKDLMFDIYQNGVGQSSIVGTKYGLLNSVTLYTDHYKNYKNNDKVKGMWFGSGEQMKNKALQLLS